jgi:hypothetical protein
MEQERHVDTMPVIEVAAIDRALAADNGAEAVREGAHDLRNSMNALLLSAGALGMRADSLPTPLGDIARQAQQQGRQCAAKLTALLERVDQLLKSRDS